MFRQHRPTRKQICPECRGSGKVMRHNVWNFGWKPCQACNGTGQIEIPIIPEMRQRQRNPLGI